MASSIRERMFPCQTPSEAPIVTEFSGARWLLVPSRTDRFPGQLGEWEFDNCRFLRFLKQSRFPITFNLNPSAMFLRSIRDIAKPQQFAIIDLLKRSTGMPVAEMGRALKMSYMGVKQHCADLERKGWLDTWRRPVPNGRPEKLYRLTTKAAGFFPEAGNEMTLEILHSIHEIYGGSAPDKLLINYFVRKTAAYLKKIKGGSIAERATAFAKLRNMEGHCAEVECDNETGFRITEYHSPLKDIVDVYPTVRRMEEQMFNKVLMTTVQRLEERASGLTKFVYLIPTVSHRQAAAS